MAIGTARGPWLAANLKNLLEKDCDWKSPASKRYNCFAWAVGDESRWWQPSGDDDHYWPEKYPSGDYSTDTALLVLADEGFVVCDGPTFEQGFEKIALFENQGEWKHVAIQVSETTWKSKLGDYEDILHPLEPMSASAYGNIARYMKRQKSI